MEENKTIFQQFFQLNRKAIPYLAILFLVVNLILQVKFFGDFFLNIEPNADETGYRFFVENTHQFSWSLFSNSSAQPFSLLTYLFNLVFNDAQFTIRFVSLLSSLGCFVFLFIYYRKNRFVEIVEGNKTLNNLIIFNVLFAVFFILSCHFIGTSDAFSVAFAIPGFILLTEVLFNDKRHNVILIGALFAISFTSRPTFLIVLFAYLLSLLLFFSSKLFTKKLILVGVFFAFFTAIINFSPIVNKGELVLDVKEIPSDTGTSWFEMNYLMAKKWDSGEIPNTQWLSATDVIIFKKENPNFIFPKNQLDILLNDKGFFFRQMFRMFRVSMYTSFRYLYFLFPFLIFYIFLKDKGSSSLANKKVYFTVSFYFISLIVFMVSAFKLMEFRWMYILIVFYAFYAIHFSKGISHEKRIVLFNLIFLSGIGFFILKMLK